MNEEEYDKATKTIMDLKLQVKESIQIKEETSSSLKDELEKSVAENKKQSEEISKFKGQLQDKENELTCKIQDKDNEISTLLEKNAQG